VRMKAYTYELGETEWASKARFRRLAGSAQEAHERLVELVAEGKDELMKNFLKGKPFRKKDLVPALHEAIREDRIFPVIFARG